MGLTTACLAHIFRVPDIHVHSCSRISPTLEMNPSPDTRSFSPSQEAFSGKKPWHVSSSLPSSQANGLPPWGCTSSTVYKQVQVRHWEGAGGTSSQLLGFVSPRFLCILSSLWNHDHPFLGCLFSPINSTWGMGRERTLNLGWNNMAFSCPQSYSWPQHVFSTPLLEPHSQTPLREKSPYPLIPFSPRALP